MRLRVQISRHTLPDTKLLWQAKPSETISQFLQAVNEHYPIEAAEWSLDDYIVQVGDYEALHYHTVRDVLKADDRVTIRPLQSNDVKRRRLLGREQIADNGMHLIDGVPFGRVINARLPLNRPAIRIPARRLARSDMDEEQLMLEVQADNAYSAEEIERQLALIPLQEDQLDDDMDDDDDGSYHVEGSATSGSDERSNCGSVSASSDQSFNMSQTSWEGCEAAYDAADTVVKANTHSTEHERSVKASEPDRQALVCFGQSTTSSSESDSDSDSTSSSDSSTSASVCTSSDDTDTSDSDNSEQGPEIRTSKKSAPKSTPTPAPKPTQKQQQQLRPPFSGQQRTKDRNNRRKQTKKLKWLKSRGILHENATHEDLKVYIESNESQATPDSSGDSFVAAINARKDTPSVEEIPSKKMQSDSNGAFADELEAKRNELLAAIASGGIDVNMTNGAPQVDDTETPTPLMRERRAKIDIASSRRMLLGSLGVRVPRTEVEKTKVQEKLASQGLRKPITKTAHVEPTNGLVQVEPNDGDFWRSKIFLSAVECCDDAEQPELSTPPFPFYKGWFQSRKKRKRTGDAYSGSSSKRPHYEDGYTYTNCDENALDYGDDDLETETREKAADEQDSASRQLMAEATLSQQLHDETASVPDLPEDPSALPRLSSTEVRTGDVITYSVLEVSAATGWAPAISPVRTATVVEYSSAAGTIHLRLARRDVTEHEYDEEGNRVYGKFEMAVEDPDEEQEEQEHARRVCVPFADLIEPRLLARAAAVQIDASEPVE